MTCGNFTATLWTSCPLDHVTQLHDRSPVKPQMWHDKDTLKVTLLPNLGSFFTGFGKTSAVYLWTHTLASNCFQSLESFSVSLLSTHCWVWSAFFLELHLHHCSCFPLLSFFYFIKLKNNLSFNELFPLWKQWPWWQMEEETELPQPGTTAEEMNQIFCFRPFPAFI